ncbi:MAG: PAS domain-containing protein [Rhodospirillaceae bacterium]|jgi:PAS domain S-box-containing protein|nr:PAS domain-containing protein [Rhodospirillaceae bacterium]MBT4044232.1 PAS domain-containing protein [Rhodospirillaceae bacterium]MBT4688800.1 PAS domain-containing protein [Rhodospirillaceae bacterium]MBT5083374.1 PAS domain-containing protein [Rhodospirillaceae bacterium]MBT5525576.1 PAS domain-containing protein [Rhodospirillaceae bacterium]
MSNDQTVTGVERHFDENELIVSKTDLKGHITYANDVFLDIADYTEKEVLGQPHSLIRHPDMPRSVFKLLWDTLHEGSEIFAYVINRAKNGDHYWVLAHVTPSKDANNQVIGYHSNRRVPDKRIIMENIIPLYKSLRDEENRHENRKDGMNAAYDMVGALLADKGVGYDEFVATL